MTKPVVKSGEDSDRIDSSEYVRGYAEGHAVGEVKGRNEVLDELIEMAENSDPSPDMLLAQRSIIKKFKALRKQPSQESV